MGRQIRKWFIRIFAVLIVAFMVISLGANFFMARNQQKEIAKQQEESKYTYVDEKKIYKLEAIDQTILLPKGMELDSTTTQEETNMIVNQYQGVRYEDLGISVGLIIMEMDPEKGANFNGQSLMTMEQAAQQYKESEYENKNYITLKGDNIDYLMVLQTVFDDNSKYGYEIDYTITDQENMRQYMVSLFLLEPKQASKTDMLKLDQMGKEMMSQTKYITAPVYDQFALPADQENTFNHILG